MAINIVDRIIEDAIFPPPSAGPANMPTTDIGVATYTALGTDRILSIDTTNNGPVTISLPNAPGHELVIKDGTGNAAVNNITVNCDGGGFIDDQASISITVSYGALRVYFDTGRRGNNWLSI